MGEAIKKDKMRKVKIKDGVDVASLVVTRIVRID